MRMVTSETTVCATELWPLVLALVVTVGLFVLACPAAQKGSTTRDPGQPEDKDVVITIVYDNNPGQKELTTAWGFACLVEGPEETILFDTGADGEILLANAAALGIDLQLVDAVVISHVHRDHLGGLAGFLEVNSRVAVYLPQSFPRSAKDTVNEAGATLVEVTGPVEVCQHVSSTGELGERIVEQSLVVETPRGLVVITGCAHPGVANMAEAAHRQSGRPVYAVLGGFHMGGASVDEIHRVVRDLRKMGVQQVAPCHCSGDKTRRLMKDGFREGYLPSGAGVQFAFGKLKPGENRRSRRHAEDRAF